MEYIYIWDIYGIIIYTGENGGEIHVGFYVGKCEEEIMKCGKSMEHVEKSSLYIVYERLQRVTKIVTPKNRISEIDFHHCF